MTDSVLDLLKLLFLGLLYVFFGRVLWAVWSEVRQSNQRAAAPSAQSASPGSQASLGSAAGHSGRIAPLDPTPIGTRQPIVKAGKPQAKRLRGANPTRLVVIEPRERKGVTYHIDSRLTFGREADNSVVLLDDAYLSAHHAVVVADDSGAVTVTDLASRNGTLHNGSRIDGTRRVAVGDRIQIGYTVLEAH